MILGRVVGEVWATRRHPGLAGRKLLIIQPHLWYDPPHEIGHLCAVDPVGAGVGEDVVVCLGDPGRRVLDDSLAASASPALPVDATVMAIVDNVEIAGHTLQRPLRFVGPVPRWAQGVGAHGVSEGSQ